ncbi:EF-hand calcium-binding domain-containing protein 1-like [Aphis craccivora]|uniref:EF-hand calcium-binding domain-containing protein 1-like n=1 Tax=Aphis craccivora TaxID=307492 RepID=A0A6G0YED4_APHCR|nr:EF-hand calcium-binding domain-containing protein 1-like [Aphis craccivora]KAF0755051.1 EF-hand calcium-binding domain-containing protein 1-like [Aphis craccivora]KAF0755363.1 EF-hand calcium-binding domain-containing protein 1-like [Aphis craccivora]
MLLADSRVATIPNIKYYTDGGLTIYIYFFHTPNILAILKRFFSLNLIDSNRNYLPTPGLRKQFIGGRTLIYTVLKILKRRSCRKIFFSNSTNLQEHLTESEFVKILPLVLKSKLPTDLINFCFELCTEITRSPNKENDQSFVDFVMAEVDKDRDNRISLESG